MSKPTLKQIAERFGISPSSVSRAKAKGVNVQSPEQMLEHLRSRRTAGATAGPGAQELNEARRRKLDLECERLEFELDVRRGEFVTKDSQHEIGFKAGQIHKEAFLKLVNDLPPLCAGLEAAAIADVLDDYVHEKLVETSQAWKVLGAAAEIDTADGSEEPSAA